MEKMKKVEAPEEPMEKKKDEEPEKCPMDFGAKKEEYRAMKETGGTEVWKVTADEAQVIESPNIYQGIHKMGPSSLKCLVYELNNPISHSFFLLKPVRHRTIIRHEAFYEEGRKFRIVLSGADSMLKDLVTPGQASMFFTMAEERTDLTTSDLTTMFRTFILDLCSGLEHLFSMHLYPKKISLNDLFVCNDGPTRKRIQLLVLEVQKIKRVTQEDVQRTMLWGQVRSVIESIRETTGSDKLNEFAQRFINSIGNDVSMLSEYPHSWSYDRKGSYLIDIMSADESTICDRLQTSDLEWPVERRTHKLPHLLHLLIENASTRFPPYVYSTEEPYDYLKLSRTVYKHYPSICKDVALLKDTCPSREDFLKKMEQWEPLIWCIIYDAIGLIASL